MTHTKTRLLAVGLALWVCLIFGNSLMPDKESHVESGAVQKAASAVIKRADIKAGPNAAEIYQPWLSKNETNFGDFFVRKTAHVVEYAVLGVFCLLLAVRLRRRWPLLLLGPAAAFTDEMVVQRYLTTGRNWSLKDVGLDIIGFALGCGACLAAMGVARLIRRRKSRGASSIL